MALTVTANMTTISTCDTLTGWSTSGLNLSLDSDVKKQGTNAISAALTVNGINTMTFTPVSPINLTNQHVRLWVNSTLTAYMATQTNNGMQLWVRDGTNTAYWTVAGSDTYLGGWLNVVVYMGSTPTSGTANLSSITSLGIRINTILKPKNVNNTWVDYLRYGNGLKFDDSNQFGLDNVYAVDFANGYGIIEKVEDVFFVSGELLIGDNVSTRSTNFSQAESVIIFTNKNVSSTLYKIQGVGNSTGTTNINLSNCVIKSGTSQFLFDFDDSAISNLLITGTLIEGASSCLFKSGQDINNTVFYGCGTVYPSTSLFDSNTISSSITTRALKVVSGHNITNCKFLNNINATWYDAIGDYQDDGNYYEGNTYDVENSSTGLVTIYGVNGSNVSTYVNTNGGTTSIIQSVTLTIGRIRENSDVWIYRTSDKSLLSFADPVVSPDGSPIDGIQYYKHDFPYDVTLIGGVDVYISIFSIGYVNERINYTLPAINSRINISQRVDRNYFNPD